MYFLLSLVGVLVVVLGVAAAYDLRARRLRSLSGDFSVAARTSSRDGIRSRRARDARTRPSSTFGPGSGPPLGPPGI